MSEFEYYPPPEPRDKDKFDALYIYTEALSSTQNGHAMWHAFTREVTLPDEIDIQIGDVGYWYKGDFFRFFNVFHEDGHPFNLKGVPEGFRPLPLDEDKDLTVTPAYFTAGDVLCGGQLKRVDQGKPQPEGDLKSVSSSCMFWLLNRTQDSDIHIQSQWYWSCVDRS